MKATWVGTISAATFLLFASVNVVNAQFSIPSPGQVLEGIRKGEITADPIVNTYLEAKKTKDKVDTAVDNAGTTATKGSELIDQAKADSKVLAAESKETLEALRHEVARLNETLQSNVNDTSRVAVVLLWSLVALVILNIGVKLYSLRPRPVETPNYKGAA